VWLLPQGVSWLWNTTLTMLWRSCSLVLWAAGPKDAAIFAAGVAASLAYLALLQRKTDAIGAPEGLASKLGTGRFLVPVALIAGLAARHASDSTVRESRILEDVLMICQMSDRHLEPLIQRVLCTRPCCVTGPAFELSASGRVLVRHARFLVLQDPHARSRGE
jgi:hypothetical protein